MTTRGNCVSVLCPYPFVALVRRMFDELESSDSISIWRGGNSSWAMPRGISPDTFTASKIDLHELAFFRALLMPFRPNQAGFDFWTIRAFDPG